jgi:hypothetical protein
MFWGKKSRGSHKGLPLLRLQHIEIVIASKKLKFSILLKKNHFSAERFSQLPTPILERSNAIP